MARTPRTVNERLDRLERGLAALRSEWRKYAAVRAETEIVGFRPEDADEDPCDIEEASIEPVGHRRHNKPQD